MFSENCPTPFFFLYGNVSIYATMPSSFGDNSYRIGLFTSLLGRHGESAQIHVFSNVVHLHQIK